METKCLSLNIYDNKICSVKDCIVLNAEVNKAMNPGVLKETYYNIYPKVTKIHEHIYQKTLKTKYVYK